MHFESIIIKNIQSRSLFDFCFTNLRVPHMRKKLSILFLIFFPFCVDAAVEPASIELPVTQDQQLQQLTFKAPLDILHLNVVYRVTCTVNNLSDSSIRLLFEPRLLSSNRYGDVMLNEKPIQGNSDYLQTGVNQLRFQILMTQQDSEQYNRFVLSSAPEAVYRVEACRASAVLSGGQDKSPSKISRSAGGFFFAINETDHRVTIGVGNFWPTLYVLEPHNQKVVWVSTDNQDIRIKQIE